MKRLVVLCDGTWKSAFDYRTGGESNVVRLSQLIVPRAENASQVSFYDPGVGTGCGVMDRIMGGATGQGLDLNLAECYRFLIQHYEPGDELFLFGFSRGAYTVRCLAGLIRKCGILRRDWIGWAAHAVRYYRNAMHPDDVHPTNVRLARSHEERTPIRFVGVFDTVGTMGVPGALGIGVNKDRYRFHDAVLSSIVQTGVQALAIDEKRKQFLPVPWRNTRKEGQTILQRWFPGCHSDVGGGLDEHGLGDVTLQWMVEHARNAGLVLDEKLLAERCRPNALAQLHESRTGFYRLWHPRHRPIRGSRLDASTRQRWKEDPNYRPRKLRGKI